MDEQQAQVVIVIRSQPGWLSAAQLVVTVLFGAAAAAVTFFFVYCSHVAMRFLEGIGGP